ncbi:MAG: amino acid carrier protein [Acidobacteria bacterium]|nr:amino acid carrier protein [Acidobacteriota bacterium]
MTDSFFHWLGWANGYLWSTGTFLLLMVSGIVFSIWTRMVQYRSLTHGVKVLSGAYDDPNDAGAISSSEALAASLSGTVGLGNIGGVALAITAGGPGALFWMWVIGFLGMALKTVEVTQALMFRNTDDPDDPHGGAMWVIEQTWGRRGGVARLVAKVLAATFALATIASTITGGNMFQAWNVADLTARYFAVPRPITGVLLALLVGLVILGGVKRIGHVAGRLVPVMCALYLVAVVGVIALYAEQVPGLLLLVVESAFTPTEASGAFLGGTLGWAFSVGMRRALFSNEAGQGSGPIAHSAARTHEPARQGVLGGLGPFIDTICVCTLTALVILVTGVWNRGPVGEFHGQVELLASAGSASHEVLSWQVEASDDVANLPPLADGSEWNAGRRFFLIGLVEGAGSRDTGTNRVTVTGDIVVSLDESMAAGEPAPHIVWNSVDLVLDEWSGTPKDIRLAGPQVYQSLDGASLTAFALDKGFPGLGKWVVTLTSWLFALSTIITWSYYGEQSATYLVGERGVRAYRVLYVVLVFVGAFAIADIGDMEAFIDLGTGAMLWANMPIVLLLSRETVNCLNDYFRRLKAGEFDKG